MKPDKRQQMIERTVVLLTKKGLQGASFSEILEASGAPRGSLYHNFPGGKDELVLEAMALSASQAMAVLDRLAGKPADEIAEAFVGFWRQILTRSKFCAGCAIAAVTAAAETAELRAQAGDVFRRWRQRLAELLEQGGLPSGRGAPRAVALIAACEGAVVLSRAEGSLEPLELTADDQLRAIRSELS